MFQLNISLLDNFTRTFLYILYWTSLVFVTFFWTFFCAASLLLPLTLEGFILLLYYYSLLIPNH